ncbi:hypothetical protein [Rubinisphaera margarita]|uniref:hypothetical protein n=1 Tax=Rubinisphaera margarita TaxID=2909586 RepID=UPI001EE7D734|nr:hypothetical protein [Rubinisphaera margarita]MCG6156165.1 hypothetical protein [Rubinisphaera margarita]
MKLALLSFVMLSSFAVALEATSAQEEAPTPAPVTTTAEPEGTSDSEMLDDAADTTKEVADKVQETTKEAIDFANKKSEEIARQIDESPQAKEYSAGILQPIYAMAEYLSFSWFHWLAFTFMVSGVVSFALQLVLAKLAVLAHGGFSIAQLLTDAQGLIISLVGLFLTTQAATENSAFTSSPAAVLSASAVGIVAGFLFYLWGQSEELQALRGRKAEARVERAKKKS